VGIREEAMTLDGDTVRYKARLVAKGLRREKHWLHWCILTCCKAFINSDIIGTSGTIWVGVWSAWCEHRIFHSDLDEIFMSQPMGFKTAGK